MSERSAIDEARLAQVVLLVVAAVFANSLSSDRSLDARTHAQGLIVNCADLVKQQSAELCGTTYWIN